MGTTRSLDGPLLFQCRLSPFVFYFSVFEELSLKKKIVTIVSCYATCIRKSLIETEKGSKIVFFNCCRGQSVAVEKKHRQNERKRRCSVGVNVGA